jgi:hypothetical protein
MTKDPADPRAVPPGHPLGARDYYRWRRGLPEDDFLPAYARGQQGQDDTTSRPTQEDAMAGRAGKAKRTVTRKGAVSAETKALRAQGMDAGAMGKTLQAAEKFLASLSPEMVKTREGPQASALTASITSVSTNSQAGAQTAFLLNSDALALVLNISVSQDVINAGLKFNARFQVIEFATNNVKINNAWGNNNPFSWGPSFWISLGNNWGPSPGDYTTPAKWGLSAGLWVFRGFLEIVGAGTFAVSTEHVFRVR